MWAESLDQDLIHDFNDAEQKNQQLLEEKGEERQLEEKDDNQYVQDQKLEKQGHQQFDRNGNHKNMVC